MRFYRLEPELSGCNKEVAALHSDHYRQVPLYFDHVSEHLLSPLFGSPAHVVILY